MKKFPFTSSIKKYILHFNKFIIEKECEMEDDSEFKIDPTGYDEMIRQAIADVIAEKFMNGDMYLKIVDDYKKNGDEKEIKNGKV